MADIYDLVQQSLARSQGGRNQFYDPTADFAMQIPSIIQNQRDVELVGDKSAMADMNTLLGSANTLQSLNNAQKMINEFDPSNASLEPGQQFLQNKITTKMNTYKQGELALNEISGNLHKYEDYTEDEMQLWDVETLKNEMLEVADLNDKLAYAKESGLKYTGSKTSLDRGGRAVKDYYSKLQSTWKALATEGIVTDDEAKSIFFEEFDEVKGNVVKDADSRIAQLNKEINSWTKLYTKSMDEGNWDALAMNMDLPEGSTQETISASYNRLMQEARLKKNLLQKKRNKWSTTPSDDYDKMSLDELEFYDMMTDTDPNFSKLSEDEKQALAQEHLQTLYGGKKPDDKVKSKYDMPTYAGKDEDFNYSGDSVYEGILSMEQGPRALRNNNPGAINFPSKQDSVFITDFGAIKNPEETYFEYQDDDGNRIQVTDIHKVPEDKKGNVKEYTTATFPSKEMGQKALQHIIREKLKSADGDIDKFVQSYTGLKPGSSEFNAYKQKLSSGEADPSFVEEYNLDDAAKIIGTLGVVYSATNPEQIKKAGKIIADNTIKSAKYIKGSLDITGPQIKEFLDSKQVEKSLNKIENLEKQIKQATGENKKTLQKRLKNIKNSRSTHWAKKWFGKNWKSRMKDVDNLWDINNRSRWNIFNVRKSISNAVRNPGMKSRFLGALGRGYATGDLVNRALGTDLGVPGQILTGVGTEKVAKSAYSKLKKVVKSPKGRKWLLKKVGKKAAKKIIAGTLAGGGVASWATGIAGVALAGKDIYDVLFSDTSEIDEILKEIE